jgi:hypothetical protein
VLPSLVSHFSSCARRALRLACALALALAAFVPPPEARAQEVAKYGADFLAGGVNARALGMGGAYVALADDVSAGYWNPAGLSAIEYPQLSYMHVERFAGAVSFDYAALAVPVNERSTVSLSVFRSGVNDIANTLDAWNPDLDQPRANYDSRITRFSAADWAFFLGYARTVGERVTVGVTGKAIRRTIGDFADAWGYSFDLGVQYRAERLRLGLNVQDVSTMLQSWSVNPDAFEVDCTNADGETFEACMDPETGEAFATNAERFANLFDQNMPEGQTELVLPVARFGSGYVLPLAEAHRVTLGLDVDVAFDGQQAFAPNVGEVSFHPRAGAEYAYKGVVALRGGVNRVQTGDGIGLDLTPSVGAGINIKQLSLDFSFGDFAGLAAEDLGYTYRISARLTLEQPRFKRGGEE